MGHSWRDATLGAARGRGQRVCDSNAVFGTVLDPFVLVIEFEDDDPSTTGVIPTPVLLGLDLFATQVMLLTKI